MKASHTLFLSCRRLNPQAHKHQTPRTGWWSARCWKTKEMKIRVETRHLSRKHWLTFVPAVCLLLDFSVSTVLSSSVFALLATSWPPQQKVAALLRTATPRPPTDSSDSTSSGLLSSSRSASAMSLLSASSSPQASLLRLRDRLDSSDDAADTSAGTPDSPARFRFLEVFNFWKNFFPFPLQKKRAWSACTDCCDLSESVV